MGLDCGEEKVLVGVVDDADDGLAVDGEAEGDAGIGKGVDEVCCSYEVFCESLFSCLGMKMKGR